MSQSVSGFTTSTSALSVPRETPQKPRKSQSFSKGMYTLREVITSKDVRETKLVCNVCFPMAQDMKMSSDDLSVAMRAKIASEPAKFAPLKGDPPGTFQNLGPSTPRNAHLEDHHKITRESVSPRSDNEPAPAIEVRIPGVTQVEQDWVWMFVDNAGAEHPA